MTSFKLYLPALGLASLFGCSDPGVERLATQREAIIGGTISSSKDDAVVQVSDGESGCTGTLIAPTVVLTALHCVAGFDSRFTFSCRSDGTLPPGATTGKLGPSVDPKTVSVGFGVNVTSERIYAKAIYTTGSTDVCHDDLAVIVLNSAPAIGNVPLVSLRFARPTRKGELTRAVGYGDVEQTDTERGRQVRTGIAVLGVGGPDASTPGDPNVRPRTVQVGEGPCHGDSGGPLFSQETGAEIGVYSLLEANTCTGSDVRNTYTRIASFEAVIRMALKSVGEEPLVEPAEPDGTAGDAGATSGPAVGGGSSGGSGGNGETMGEAGAPADPGEGSGSFRDSSCAFRAAGRQERGSWMLASSALVLVVWTSIRRRRSRSRPTS